MPSASEDDSAQNSFPCVSKSTGGTVQLIINRTEGAEAGVRKRDWKKVRLGRSRGGPEGLGEKVLFSRAMSHKQW